MKNIAFLAKVNFWLRHITWVHTHAQFEGKFMNTLAAIGKTGFGQGRMLNQDYQLFGLKENY